MSDVDDVYDRLTWQDSDVVLVMSVNGKTFYFRRIDVENLDADAIMKLTEYGVELHIDVLRPFKTKGVLIRSATQLF